MSKKLVVYYREQETLNFFCFDGDKHFKTNSISKIDGDVITLELFKMYQPDPDTTDFYKEINKKLIMFYKDVIQWNKDLKNIKITDETYNELNFSDKSKKLIRRKAKLNT